MESNKSINANLDNRPIRSSPPIAPRTSAITNNPARANQSVNATLPVESSSVQSNDQENIYVPHIVLEPKSNPSDIVEQKSDVDITPEISHGVPSVELEPASGLKTNVSMVDVRPAAKSTAVGYESVTEVATNNKKFSVVEPANIPVPVDTTPKTNNNNKFALTAKIAVIVIIVVLLVVMGFWFTTSL